MVSFLCFGLSSTSRGALSKESQAEFSLCFLYCTSADLERNKNQGPPVFDLVLTPHFSHQEINVHHKSTCRLHLNSTRPLALHLRSLPTSVVPYTAIDHVKHCLTLIPRTNSRAHLTTIQGSAIRAVYSAPTGPIVNQPAWVLIQTLLMSQDQRSPRPVPMSATPVVTEEDQHTALGLLKSLHASASQRWLELEDTADNGLSVCGSIIKTQEDTIAQISTLHNIAQLRAANNQCCKDIQAISDGYETLRCYASMCDAVDKELEVREANNGEIPPQLLNSLREHPSVLKTIFRGTRSHYFDNKTAVDDERSAESTLRYSEAMMGAAERLSEQEDDPNEAI